MAEAVAVAPDLLVDLLDNFQLESGHVEEIAEFVHLSEFPLYVKLPVTVTDHIVLPELVL